MPALVEERETLQHEIFGATPERMLREAEALEALTADIPLSCSSTICTGATMRRWTSSDRWRGDPVRAACRWSSPIVR
jgi:hypothetical protein